ncbi:hypothetical protein HYW75_02065 [Candidatus Pacearchaeota archaeon]|nr:hypothetical protein [Candidatus Pacearchaeota archaeon]
MATKNIFVKKDWRDYFGILSEEKVDQLERNIRKLREKHREERIERIKEIKIEDY